MKMIININLKKMSVVNTTINGKKLLYNSFPIGKVSEQTEPLQETKFEKFVTDHVKLRTSVDSILWNLSHKLPGRSGGHLPSFFQKMEFISSHTELSNDWFYSDEIEYLINNIYELKKYNEQNTNNSLNILHEKCITIIEKLDKECLSIDIGFNLNKIDGCCIVQIENDTVYIGTTCKTYDDVREIRYSNCSIDIIQLPTRAEYVILMSFNIGVLRDIKKEIEDHLEELHSKSHFIDEIILHVRKIVSYQIKDTPIAPENFKKICNEIELLAKYKYYYNIESYKRKSDKHKSSGLGIDQNIFDQFIKDIYDIRCATVHHCLNTTTTDTTDNNLYITTDNKYLCKKCNNKMCEGYKMNYLTNGCVCFEINTNYKGHGKKHISINFHTKLQSLYKIKYYLDNYINNNDK